jgi:hypothetical protein
MNIKGCSQWTKLMIKYDLFDLRKVLSLLFKPNYLVPKSAKARGQATNIVHVLSNRCGNAWLIESISYW